MKNPGVIIAFLFLAAFNVTGQQYNIDIKVKGLSDSTIYIGYHFADKKYVKDTLLLDSEGTCTFSGEEELPGGVYLLVFPNMNFIEFIIGDDQVFSIATDTANMLQSLEFNGSDENTKFLEYQRFMIEQQNTATELQATKEQFKSVPDSVTSINKRLQMVNGRIRHYWERIIQENKGSLLGNMVNALRNPEMPDFEVPEGAGNVDSIKWVMGYHYNRDHFMDNIDFSDERLLRTPIVYNKLNHYVNRVLIQRPDSIIPPIRKLVERTRNNDKVFQYVVVFLLNNFMQSTIMGMDEVYVALAEDYYLSGEATWADSTFLTQLEDRVSKIRPNLIGSVAKDLIMETSTGEWASLNQVEAKFTVLYFWEPNCGHCKTATPMLYDIYKNYKDKGVEIFAVYTQDDKEEWLGYLNKNGFDWINVHDPEQNSYFRFYYDINSTPVVYLLDEKKVIIAKRISVESLGEMLDTLL